MRHESSRLRQQAQLLDEALGELTASTGSATRADALLGAMRATADNLDEAGAALQRFATELAEGHELGRRAERRVEGAGLLLEGTRVIEPWGPASAKEAERRRAQVPEVQARVDLATAHVGRARGRLEREVTRLADAFTERSRDAHSARRERGTAAPVRASSRTRLGA